MEGSTNTLQNKLGIKPDYRSYVLYPPEEYAQLLPEPIKVINVHDLPSNIDWLHAFYIDNNKLEEEIILLKSSLSKTGQLWISWPKKLSNIKSDLTDNMVRSIVLDAGLVDIKVAAVNDTWSGLKFVYRLKDR